MSVEAASKGPIDQLADLVLFAPLGFALEARQLWPRLADRGRAELQRARRHGEDVVTRGRAWAGARVEEAQEQAQAALSGLGLGGREDGSTSGPPEGVPSRPATPPSRVRAATEPPFPAEQLAIPDYDALSASQVVPRLAGLSADELEQVRQYEAGTRGRKTILNKIAQLQAG